MTSSDLSDSSGIVTGGSGFIGRAVLRHLPESARVTATYWHDESFPAWVDTCRAQVRPVRVNLRERPLRAIVARADWALLCAARVRVADSWADPVDEIQGTASMTLNSIRGLTVDRLIHVSSGAVYEGNKGLLAPSRVPIPRVPYGIAKLAAERLLDAFSEAPWWNLRFFGAFGPGEPQYKLIRRAVQAFVDGRTSFDVIGDGQNRLDPMHIDDAARCFLAVACREPENRTVDLCQGESRSVDDFLRLAFSVSHQSRDAHRLNIRHSGVTHELVLGSPDCSEADGMFGLERMKVVDGLAAYAASMRS